MSSLRLALKLSRADAAENPSPSTEDDDGEEEEEFITDDNKQPKQSRSSPDMAAAAENATDAVAAKETKVLPAIPSAEVTATTNQNNHSTEETSSFRPESKRRAASDFDWKVVPPSDRVRDHMQSLSVETSRAHVEAGLRVKVKFDGGIWYGGTVSDVGGKDKSKIRIHYDDGSDETEPFPDADNNIVVDDMQNGTHKVDASVYIPPKKKEAKKKDETAKLGSPRSEKAVAELRVTLPNKKIVLSKAKEPSVSTPRRKEQEGKHSKQSILKSPQPTGEGEEVKPKKRGRGRPRKHPLPTEPGTPKEGAKTLVALPSPEVTKSPKEVKKLSIRIPMHKLKAMANTPTVTSPTPKSPTEKRKAKKRKIAAAAAAAENNKSMPLIPEAHEAPPAPMVDDPAARTEQRRAAQQANERISTKPDMRQQDITKKKKRRRNANEMLEQLDESQRWVACDACGKWRVIPDSATIPEKWYCTDNIFDPKRNSCDIPEQTARQVAKMNRKKRRMASMEATVELPHPENELIAAAVGKRPRGRPRRVKESAAATPLATGEMENLEWVQCEKCSKWRKIAPHISASDLPEVWTCDMNTWNPASASCGAPEDKAEGLQDTGVFGNSGSAEANKFTYRHLIFGSTGRKATRPVSERARAAESLFAVQYEEDEAPTKVLYADSSAFVARAKQNLPLVDETESMSVLEVMSKSKLWQELRVASKSYKHGMTAESAPSKLSGYTYENLPKDIQQPMKDFLLLILGSAVLTGDELVEKGKQYTKSSLSDALQKAQIYCTLNVVITTLYQLVHDGTVDCVRKDSSTTCYRRHVVPRSKTKPNSSRSQHRVSRCMKIAKPWKTAAIFR